MAQRGPYETLPTPEQPSSFPERLRWIRKQMGYTQVDVSKALSCEQAMISSWESGRTRPHRENLEALVAFYQVPLFALETGEGFMEEAAKALQVRQQAQAAQAREGFVDLRLMTPPPGQVGILNLSEVPGIQKPTDANTAVRQLLQAVQRGRNAWIVIR